MHVNDRSCSCSVLSELPALTALTDRFGVEYQNIIYKSCLAPCLLPMLSKGYDLHPYIPWFFWAPLDNLANLIKTGTVSF